MTYKHTRIIRFLSLCLCFCFIFEQTGLSQVLPSALTTPLSTPPLLRYLSVNSSNPFNYFNFLLDKGSSEERVASSELNQEAKKLIHYFFLGITLPSSSFWVNLRPDSPDKITSEELAKTDLGRVLLEQDLKLKKDVSKFLHPDHPQGKQYWQRLYSTIGKDKAKKAKITTQNRVWIVPEEAVVLETEDGALVVSAKLKVLLETEYLELQNKRGVAVKTKPLPERSEYEHGREGLADRTPSNEESILNISEQLMKEIILPALTQDINTSSHYAPLRQIYHSLILAEWFKRKVQTQGLSPKGTDPKAQALPKTKEILSSPYALAIDQFYTQGLESETPWEKDTFYQQYLKSYSQGEYKLEANLFGLRRMYWSGGVLLGLGPEVNPEFKFDIILRGSSPLQENKVIPQDTLTNAITVTYEDDSISDGKGLPKGKIEVHATPSIEKSEEAPRSPEKGLSVEEIQPKEEGASEGKTTSSALKKDEEGVPKKFIERLWDKFRKQKGLDRPHEIIWTPFKPVDSKTVKESKLAFTYSDPEQNFSGVDLEHFVWAQNRLAEQNLALEVLQKALSLLGIKPNLPKDIAYEKIYAALAEARYTKEIIDLINQDAYGNHTYEDPRLRIEIDDQNKNPKVQGVLEAVSNSLDALGLNIGQFGKGVKQILGRGIDIIPPCS